MTLICMKMKLHAKLIFIRKVSYLGSFWNRSTRELGNGLLKTALVKGNKIIHFAVDDFISIFPSFLCNCQYITALRITYSEKTMSSLYCSWAYGVVLWEIETGGETCCFPSCVLFTYILSFSFTTSSTEPISWSYTFSCFDTFFVLSATKRRPTFPYTVVQILQEKGKYKIWLWMYRAYNACPNKRQ